MKTIKYILIITVSIFILSCGGSTSTGPSAADYLEDGWNDYDSGNYTESLNNFQSATDKDDSLKEAYIGIALSYLRSEDHSESETVNTLENNLLSDSNGDNLKAAQAILLGIKMKDISNSTYIYDNLYKNELDSINCSWDYFTDLNSEYGTDISINYLKGHIINLGITEVLIRDSSYLSDARSVLDKVLNYTEFSSLPQKVQDRTNELDVQLKNAGY